MGDSGSFGGVLGGLIAVPGGPQEGKLQRVSGAVQGACCALHNAKYTKVDIL